MTSEKKLSDESVAAVDQWAETAEVDVLLTMGMSSIHGWTRMQAEIASLLDAQRDAVLDEVTRAVSGLRPEWVSDAIERLRR